MPGFFAYYHLTKYMKKKQTEKVIGIALDGVLRNITISFERIYSKHIEFNGRPIKQPINMYKLLDSFEFKNADELNTFIRTEAPVIWGRADEMRRGAMEDLNSILVPLKEKGYRVVLISKESQKTKGGTLFWLGDRATEVNEIRFIEKNEDFWEGIDTLVTANPEIFKLKPKGQRALLYNSPTNKEVRYARRIRNIKEILNKI